MSLFDYVYKRIMNFFISSDPKWDPDNVTCTIDDEEVEITECDGPIEELRTVPPSFVKSLERKGFTFNSNNNRWSRTWTAKTRDGEERTLEVYEKKEDGEWISLMYGNEGHIYYQNSLGYETLTES